MGSLVLPSLVNTDCHDFFSFQCHLVRKDLYPNQMAKEKIQSVLTRLGTTRQSDGS